MNALSTLEAMRSAFPGPLLAYVLNTNESSLDELILDEARLQSLALLKPYVENVRTAAADSPDAPQSLAVIAGPFAKVTGPDVGFATYLRITSGGDVPTHDDVASDPVAESFFNLLRDTYPLYLLGEQFFSHHDISICLGSHSALRNMVPAVYADRALRKLFPHTQAHPKDVASGVVDARTIWSQLYFRSGSGASVRLTEIPSMLVFHTINVASLLGVESAAAFVNVGFEALEACRKLATGKRYPLPLAVGFSHLTVSPAAARIDLAQGVLRPADELAMRPLQVYTRLSGPLSSVLISNHEDEILDRPIGTFETEPFRNQFEEFHAENLRTIDQARLAIILALHDQGAMPTPIPNIYMTLNPLVALQSAGNELQSTRADLVDFVLTDSHKTGVIAWSGTVARHFPPSLDIAMRRILSAAVARFDAADGFIDAVMAWENLFGDKQETTFKVCASIAVLLEEREEDRSRLFKELTTFYAARSDLVHGVSTLVPSQAVKFRDEALRIAVAAIRSAFTVPGLLSLPSSKARMQAILLHQRGPARLATPESKNERI